MRGSWRAFDAFRRFLTAALTTVALAASVLLLLHVVVGAVMRYGFNAPLRGAIEYVEYWWMPAIVFAGLAIAQRREEHIVVTLLADRFGRGTQTAMRLLAATLAIVVLATVAYFGFESASYHMDLDARSTVARIAIWPVRFLIPLGCLAFTLEIVASEVRHLRADS